MHTLEFGESARRDHISGSGQLPADCFRRDSDIGNYIPGN